MKRFATFLVIAYGLMLCGVGAAGILTARWELTQVFGLDVGAWSPSVQATFLNQYRFLKALELGGGFFCIFLRTSILTGGTAGRVFLALVGGGVLARSLAWVVDGRPSSPFVVFLVLEALVLVVTAVYLRRSESTV
jgi:hypothetical protein